MKDGVRINDSKPSICQLGPGDPSTCAYKFLYDNLGLNDTHIFQCFVMRYSGTCIKPDIYVKNMFMCGHSDIILILLLIKEEFFIINLNPLI